MSERCQVCRGERKVRLPLYRPVTVSMDATALKMAETYREYPCPECAPPAAVDKVRVLECHFQADTRYEGQQGYREHIIGHGVTVLAHEIEKAGLVRIQHAPADSREMKRGYRLSVGVVSPNVVADLDAQREAAEDKFAELAINLAAAEIQNWGSYYGHPEILKRDATRMLSDGLRLAKETRPKQIR